MGLRELRERSGLTLQRLDPMTGVGLHTPVGV